MNQIIELRAILQPDGTWLCSVTKTFAPEYGGGYEVFTNRATNRLYQVDGAVNPHYACESLKSMITMLPVHNSATTSSK